MLLQDGYVVMEEEVTVVVVVNVDHVSVCFNCHRMAVWRWFSSLTMSFRGGGSGNPC